MNGRMAELIWLRIRKVIAALQSREGRRALRRGIAPCIEHRHLVALPVAHVLDIGANRGQFALFARQTFGVGRIDAFEPLAECANDIRAILPFATVHQVALSDRVGEQNFHISRANDSSSLREITPKQTEHFPGTEEVATRSVPTTTFEAWSKGRSFQRPALAKIDVQGSEINVIRGMGSALERIDYVYAELSFVELYSGQALAAEIIAEMHEAGFILTGLYNTKRDGMQTIQADALFCRRDAGAKE